jgi:hypothetical protein
MALTLKTIPGYSDLSDTVLAAGDPAYGIHTEEISGNAAFGMVRLEVFQGQYFDGDTVPLPVSGIDGYVYSRAELLYVFNVRSSTDKDSGWITGYDTLWFANWDVDQTTGKVFSSEWYRRSGTNLQAQETHDGQILVYTIGQRQRQNVIMATAASYSAVSAADIATDKPWKQALAQGLDKDAKFACVNTEVFYCGEFTDTLIIPRGVGSALVSPADGYQYAYAECKFIACWRWTTDGAAYTVMPENSGQLGPILASIDSTGHVSITIKMMDDSGGLYTRGGAGRIAAFAFCTRSATPGSTPLANSFAEIPLTEFIPGHSLRASTVLAIKKNVDEAVLTPEFFGPTVHANGDTIALPVSAVDGYTYARSELTYIWTWADTTPAPGTHVRVPLFFGYVNPTTGVLTLECFRLPPGGPIIDDDNSLCRATVIVMARRQQAAPALVDTSNSGNAPSDLATTPVGQWQEAEIAIPSTTRGNFTLAHGLGTAPLFGWIQNETNGIIRFQTTRYDGTNVYLNASADGLTGHVILFYLN